jgi:hypothetical protein
MKFRIIKEAIGFQITIKSFTLIACIKSIAPSGYKHFILCLPFIKGAIIA